MKALLVVLCLTFVSIAEGGVWDKYQPLLDGTDDLVVRKRRYPRLKRRADR